MLCLEGRIVMMRPFFVCKRLFFKWVRPDIFKPDSHKKRRRGQSMATPSNVI